MSLLDLKEDTVTRICFDKERSLNRRNKMRLKSIGLRMSIWKRFLIYFRVTIKIDLLFMIILKKILIIFLNLIKKMETFNHIESLL